MIIEIEYYKGDTLLKGQIISFEEFKKQIKEIESIYDRKEDNFILLLCRRYNWSIVNGNLKPVYVYDRDTEKAYKVK